MVTENDRVVALAAAALLDDPDRVVLDPHHVYEKADGTNDVLSNPRFGDVPERMCVLGAIVYAETTTRTSLDSSIAYHAFFKRFAMSETRYLKEYGGAACARALREWAAS